MSPFATWLSAQAGRTDAIGELAINCVLEGTPPDTKTVTDVRRWLFAIRATRWCYRTLTQAALEYHAQVAAVYAMQSDQALIPALYGRSCT